MNKTELLPYYFGMFIGIVLVTTGILWIIPSILIYPRPIMNLGAIIGGLVLALGFYGEIRELKERGVK